MLRRVQALIVFGVCVVSIPAAAQEVQLEEEPTPAAAPAAPPPPSTPPAAAVSGGAAAPSASPPVEANPPAQPEGWHTEVSGYFRVPMALGLSSRPDPDNLTGPSHTQVSYGPNRTVDANYYSFAYTRLQEQDWAEVFVHAKRQHVDAAVGWMGYWFSGVGFRNPDAVWAPALAYVALDTDFDAGGIKPNIKLTMGAWWPKFGYFEKYDTYTLGRFRQLGEQLDLKIPVTPDVTLDLVEGFGTNRDGSFNFGAPPLYGSTTSLDLLTYENVQVAYKKMVDVSLHYNTTWTRDPNLTQAGTAGKGYADAKLAHLTVIGAEGNLRAPYLGHLWLSPSYVHVRHGWALGNGGTEVMHSQSGAGVATNYLGWTNTPDSSTGSGSLTNFGFLYENSLSSVQGKEVGTLLPDVTLSVFGLLTRAKLELPAGSTFPRVALNQLKWGADVTLQALDWLSFMLRYDLVNYDTDHAGYIFSAITPRVTVSSHFLSSERIYLQYSRYTYGDNMVLHGTWPWGAPLIAGNDILQAGTYAGKTPDQNVIKLQAEVAF